LLAEQDNGPLKTYPNIPAGQVYWVSKFQSVIKRANLDGTGNIETILSDPNLVPNVIDVDSLRGKIYWTTPINSANPGIYRANLDGTNPEFLIQVNPPFYVNTIAIDIDGGRIFYNQSAEYNNHMIQSANLDGSDIVTLAEGQDQVIGMGFFPGTGTDPAPSP
jgi:hypothetical protein